MHERSPIPTNIQVDIYSTSFIQLLAEVEIKFPLVYL